MHVAILLLALVSAGQGPTSKVSDTVFAPLWLYNGIWQITRKNLAPGAKPDNLVNQCALIGKFFACQQTVNGELSALMVFVPANKPGQYYTHSITPEARCTGRGDLAISGDHWTYSSTWDEGGKTTYYRTTNAFTGKNHIHFEQLESPDGAVWALKNSGDEVRVSGGAAKASR